MNHQRFGFVAVLSLIAILVAGPAATAQTPWAHNASGSNSRFDWSQGQHRALPGGTAHGSPDVDTSGFHFVNSYGDMSFLAQTNGIQTVHAGVYAYLSTMGRAPLSTITVREYGVWGGAPSASAVQASFSLMEYDNYEFTGPLSLPAPTFNTDGTWTTEYTFDLAPGNPLGAPWDSPLAADFDIEVINIIGVVGTAPGTFVQKLGMEILVPEPGTLFLLCAGAAVLTGRRSHR